MSEAQNEQVIRAYLEAHARKDVAAQMALVNDDCVTVYPTLRTVNKSEWYQLIEQEHEAFPDPKLSNLILICQGDMVAAVIDWDATFKKDYGSRRATNQHVAVPVVFIFEMKNGRISRCQYFWNTGLIPGWNDPAPQPATVAEG